MSILRIGREQEPIVVLDDFSADPDALRHYAASLTFTPGQHHYPGIRAPLPPDYLTVQLAAVGRIIRDVFGLPGDRTVIDASFSMVTQPPSDLTVRQRLPHCDAFARERIALVHYLAPENGGGTAFYRHRSTGFETIDDARAPVFFGQLDAELRHGGLPEAAYIDGDTPLFEQTQRVEARYNRAVIYRSGLLHSGAISRDAVLSADPLAGRLTVTAFLSADQHATGTGRQTNG